MKNKLKYLLFNIHNMVIFQVLYMDERFRNTNKGKRWVEFDDGDFLSVESDISPQLRSCSIFLRGSIRDHDYTPATLSFDTEKGALEYMGRVQESLANWAENWEGFNEPSKGKKEKYFEIKISTV